MQDWESIAMLIPLVDSRRESKATDLRTSTDRSLFSISIDMTSDNCQKLWGGRFTRSVDPEFHVFNKSIDLDKRLYAEDIQGSLAYAKALRNVSLLTEDDLIAITEGFNKIKAEWQNGTFIILDTDEDIHSANERRLSELIGDAAKKLHAGRSRNDQTLTDTKLWLRKSIDELSYRLIKLTQVLVDRANVKSCVLMPGYTHLQRAQPVKWSHWLLSYAWYIKADFERLSQIRKRVNSLPLGSGAIAGNPFNVDRSFLASQLSFDRVTENSMYTVGDRDFVAEFLFWSSLTSVHLSRLSEDLIIYSTDEFSFVRLADEYATGSSLMPQKRNPDSLEIVRGKSGTLLGRCMGFMATLKGIPSTYNKDLQEDKEALFSTFDTIRDMLVIAEGVVRTLKVNENKCREALTLNMLATDVAYYLVKKGMPFREAHHVAGQVVAVAEHEGVELCSLTLEQLKKISCRFEEDVMQIWDFGKSVEQYQVTGGTSEAAIHEQISSLRNWLKSESVK